MSTVSLLSRISEVGIRVDVDGLHDAISAHKISDEQALVELDAVMGYENLRKEMPDAFTSKDRHFNPRSKKHLPAWLEFHGKESPKSLAEPVLERILPREQFEAMMKAKRARIYLSALQGLEKRIWLDERVHIGEWVRATTGRWYAKNPQVQTMAKVIREYLVPEPGNAFYVIDWDQQELRILAHVSGEPRLKEVFESGADPHMATYERVTANRASDDPETFVKQRDIGKMLNYALIYGLDEEGLGNRLKITNEAAGLLLRAYFKALPVLSEWREEQKAIARRDGGVTTLGGRFIPIELEEGRRDADAQFDRKAVNYYCQGSGADQLDILLARIHEHGKSKSMLDRVRCPIHDALLVELPLSPAGSLAADWFKKLMEQPVFGMPSCPASIKGPSATWLQAMMWVEPEFNEYATEDA